MLQRGLFPEGSLDLLGLLSGYTRPRILEVVWFTVWSAGVATAITVLLGLPTAYALHRFRFPGRSLLQAIVLVPFVMPTVVVGLAFRRLLGEGGPLAGLGFEQSAIGIIAAMVFFNVSVVVRTVGAFWESVDPRREEAAATLGASPTRVFFSVTLPALMPGIISAASVVFLFCSTAFGVVLVMGGVRYANVETEIYLLTAQELDLGGAAALSILQLAFLVALLFGAHLLRREAGGVKRSLRELPKPSWAQLPVFVWTALVVAFLLIPMWSLVHGSLQRRGEWTLANYRALTTLGEGEVLIASPLQALGRSLMVAMMASGVALGLGMIVAVLVTRRVHAPGLRTVSRVFDGLFMLPLGVSAVTVGFGFLITLYGDPLRWGDSPLLVPMAQAIVALPLVVRALVPVLQAIDERQRQAAATLGAGPWRVLATVDLPVVRRSLVAAFGFAFAISLGEFGATSFLARSDTPTLPIVIYSLMGRREPENFGAGLAAAVLLATATTLLMLLVQRLHRRSVRVI